MSLEKSPDPAWHARALPEIIAGLAVDPLLGLSEAEAARRLARYGPNALSQEKKESFWQEFLEELREPMVLMLLVTGLLYALWGEMGEALLIFAIILALNTVEVINEQRSKKALAGLRRLAEPTAAVLRGGLWLELPADRLVPGDILLLQNGRRVPADARLLDAVGLALDESALTGESLAVEKNAAETLPPATPLAERRNLVYASSLVRRGKGRAVVVATGMGSEIFRVAGLARRVKEPRTPLQNLMGELSKTLFWFALGFSLFVPLVGILFARQPLKPMLLTGLSLTFAMIPEELPIIVTMVLALGAFRLSKHHAIVKRLAAVEALGAVTVIALDKTGTLTENRLQVAGFTPPDAEARLMQIGLICNNAAGDSVFSDSTPGGEKTSHGDALDIALLRWARAAGLDWAAPVLSEFPFDNTRRRMSVVTLRAGQAWAAVKGAPENVLKRCESEMRGAEKLPLTETARQAILAVAAGMAARGLRVLACAERDLAAQDLPQDAVERELTFVGLIGLHDPPRPQARAAIAACRRAGVRPLMITGDHPLTARAIARQVGLEDAQQAVVCDLEFERLSAVELEKLVSQKTVFARATPEHKLRIVQALQAGGERVALTGDGINDAPALVAADIGVAMGAGGTDVARAAADMVLSDDNFSTIVRAIEEGRLIYANLKKGVGYYLTCKAALVLINLLPALFLLPVPFAPVQIILMELFMDLMAAAAFVAEKAETDLLEQGPRDPRAKFMDRAMLRAILVPALGLFAAVSAAYSFTWFSTRDLTAARTAAFFAWLIGHVLLAFNLRSERQPVFQLGWSSNRLMLIWAAAVGLFIALVSLLPGAQNLIQVAPLSLADWGVILVVTIPGAFWLEARKWLVFRRRPTR